MYDDLHIRTYPFYDQTRFRVFSLTKNIFLSMYLTRAELISFLHTYYSAHEEKMITSTLRQADREIREYQRRFVDPHEQSA